MQIVTVIFELVRSSGMELMRISRSSMKEPYHEKTVRGRSCSGRLASKYSRTALNSLGDISEVPSRKTGQQSGKDKKSEIKPC